MLITYVKTHTIADVAERYSCSRAPAPDRWNIEKVEQLKEVSSMSMWVVGTVIWCNDGNWQSSPRRVYVPSGDATATSDDQDEYC